MTVKLGLVGIGGYGASYVRQILSEIEAGRAELKAAVVRNPDKYPDIMAKLPDGVTYYRDFHEFLDGEQGKVDIALIPTGIGTHREFAVAAMQAGYDVGVEKPPAGPFEDALAMATASEETGKFCAVGFQNINHPLMRDLKNFLHQGGIGELQAIRHIGLWRRLDSYYERNPWAGEIKYDDDWIFDGPLNNPLSHQLNNQLFLAGPDPLAPAEPVRVRAEFYRGHDIIKGEDTDCLEAELDNGVRLHFYATLCTREQQLPLIEIDGTGGTVTYYPMQTVEAVDKDGGKIEIPSCGEGKEGFISPVLDHFLGEAPLYCPVKWTLPFMHAMNGAYESADTVHLIGDEHKTKTPAEDSVETYIKDIEAAAQGAFKQGLLFSQTDAPWAVEKTPDFFELEGYTAFSGNFPKS